MWFVWMLLGAAVIIILAVLHGWWTGEFEDKSYEPSGVLELKDADGNIWYINPTTNEMWKWARFNHDNRTNNPVKADVYSAIDVYNGPIDALVGAGENWARLHGKETEPATKPVEETKSDESSETSESESGEISEESGETK